MTKELKYSVTITGAAFLLYEFKQVISLFEQGYEEKVIRQKVLTENLFQYKVKSSLKRSFPSVLRRIKVLDETLRRLVLEESLEVGKIVNLYAIMKTDKLFFEFMNEVIREKYESNNYLLERKDINQFITSKSEQHEIVSKWTEQTIYKLKQVYMKILLESGLLKNINTGELTRLILDEHLKKHLTYIGDIAYIRAMGE